MYQTASDSADEERVGDSELNSMVDGCLASLEHSVKL